MTRYIRAARVRELKEMFTPSKLGYVYYKLNGADPVVLNYDDMARIVDFFEFMQTPSHTEWLKVKLKEDKDGN